MLDLGCGVGRDAYILSKLVGRTGRVIGVDMTDAQLEMARRHQGEQAERFGFEQSNVAFKAGYIEDLAAVGIEDESVDLVVANCERISFDNLFAFNNYPLGRFAHDLLDANMFDAYLKLLVENFNALAVQRMMCRDQVNVDVDGRLYDCEVNHVLGLPIQVPADYDGTNCTDMRAYAGPTRDATVFDLAHGPLPARPLRTHPVCYSCSAGSGSSCGGSLRVGRKPLRHTPPEARTPSALRGGATLRRNPVQAPSHRPPHVGVTWSSAAEGWPFTIAPCI